MSNPAKLQKERIDLIDPKFIIALGDLLSWSLIKYKERDWENVPYSWSDFYSAIFRHMLKWWSGQDLDEESGRSHLLHAALNIMFLFNYTQRQFGKDDRP